MVRHRGVIEGVVRAVLVGALLAVVAPGPVEGAADRGPTCAAGRGDGESSRAPGSGRGACLPLGFEANEGQVDPQVSFLARCGEASLFLSPEEAVLSVGPSDGVPRRVSSNSALRSLAKPHPGAVLRMRFVGARPGRVLRGEDLQPGRSNYFLGSDPARWHRGVARYGRVRGAGTWDGVDLLWHGENGRAEFDFEVAPGVDPAAIAFAFEGAESSEMDGDGDLLLGTAAGTVRLSRPLAWQVRGGVRRPVEVRFAARADGSTGFALGRRDPSLALVIDPTLAYSTYLGGTKDDVTNLVASDAAGALYVVGGTSSTNFPTKFPLQATNGGGTNDAIVTKIDPAGTTLVYSTYLGGNANDWCLGISVDSSGNAYLGGGTRSTNFPVVNPVQATNAGNEDIFVVKLNAAGNALVYSTYLGGTQVESAWRTALDSSGAVYLTGPTSSTDLPVKSAFQTAYGGGTGDGYVLKINAAGSAVVYLSYLGGSGVGNEQGSALAVDANGAAYVVGFTDSFDFPLQGPIQSVYAGTTGAGNPDDAFVAKVSASGTSLVYSTFLGGHGYDDCESVAVDADGAAYVVGYTSSTDFPVVGAFQAVNKLGNTDAYVAKVLPSGTALAYSTYLGGTAADEGYGVGVDSRGTLLVSGMTGSGNFPVKNAVQSSNRGNFDAFAARFNHCGTALFSATYIGGAGNEWSWDCSVGPSGALCVTGHTTSNNFTVQSPFQSAYGGGNDSFVARYAESPPTAPSALTATPLSSTSVLLQWTDNATTETGFEIERKSAGGEFILVGSIAPDQVSFVDSSGLIPESTVTYRLCAVSGDGSSAYTASVNATLPATPVPPAAPTGLVVSAPDCSTTQLSWTDASNNEIYFDVFRMKPDGDFASVVHRPPGSTTYADTAVLPGLRYTYRVRAVSLGGNSAFTADASATLPSSLVLVLKKGSLSAGTAPGKGKATVTGSYTTAACAGVGDLDPMTGGFQVGFGNEDGPVRLTVQPDDPGWKVKKGKFTWKNAKDSTFKLKVTFDTVKGTFAVAASGLDFEPAPTNPLWFWIAPGAEGGGILGTWKEKKPGQFTTP